MVVDQQQGFWNFHPDLFGEMIQFDDLQSAYFFRNGWEKKTPTMKASNFPFWELAIPDPSILSPGKRARKDSSKKKRTSGWSHPCQLKGWWQWRGNHFCNGKEFFQYHFFSASMIYNRDDTFDVVQVIFK